MFKCPFCSSENSLDNKKCSECSTELEIDISEEDIQIEILEKGDILNGRYKIEALINSGGMGAIYKAYDMNLNNKICAIKELLDNSLSIKEKTDAIRRFKREGEILSKLKHKYLPHVSDFFTLENRYYLVMEYVDGYDLEENIKSGKKIELSKFIDLMLQVCDVFDYLHSQKPPIIYRDIKPSNIMVRHEDENIRLIDFGIARTVEGEYGTSTRVGSVGFASPEHYQGIPDKRSDIFSLGATMHALLTGVMPNLICAFEPVNKLNPDIPLRISNIVMKAVRIKPEERFQDIKELTQALSCEEEIFIEDAQEYKQVEALSAQLIVDNIELKKQIIKSLSEMKIDSAVNPLLKVLKEDDDWRIRKDAALALKNFRHKKVSLTQSLTDIYHNEYNPSVRASIIRILGLFKTSNSLDLIVSALDDSDGEVQFRAVVALGNLGDTRAFEPLCRFLDKGSSVMENDVYMSMEKIDPVFYAEWLEKKGKTIPKKSNIENMKFLFAIFMLVLISLVAFKFFSYYKNTVSVDDSFRERQKYMATGKYNLAINAFNNIISVRPDSSDSYYNLGIAYEKIGEINKAIESFNTAIDLDKNNDTYMVTLGNLYIQNKDFDKAVMTLKKAIEVSTAPSEIYLLLGITYRKMDDKKRALEVFEFCINSFPEIRNKAMKQIEILENKSASDDLNIAIEYIMQNKFNEAIDVCNEHIYNYPNSTEVYFLRGRAYFYNNEYEKARLDMEQFLLYEPDNFEVYNYLSHIHLMIENLPYSIELATKSLEISPHNNLLPYLIRGIAYYKSNNKLKARENLELYISKDPYSENAALAKDYLKRL